MSAHLPEWVAEATVR